MERSQDPVTNGFPRFHSGMAICHAFKISKIGESERSKLRNRLLLTDTLQADGRRLTLRLKSARSPSNRGNNGHFTALRAQADRQRANARRSQGHYFICFKHRLWNDKLSAVELRLLHLACQHRTIPLDISTISHQLTVFYHIHPLHSFPRILSD